MKTEAVVKSLAASIPRQVIDQSAETSRELCAATGRGYDWMKAHIRTQIDDGVWEQVFKKVGRNIVPAYRSKR